MTRADSEDSSYTYEHISEVINAAADEIIAAAGLPETGAVDVVNLLVSATLRRLSDPQLSLRKIAKSYNLADYDTDKPLSGKKALKRIIGWMRE